MVNLLLGERLSIITSKAQTTRHRALGILSESDYQIIFSDTPGLIEPKYELQEKMMQYVHESIEDSDILILLVEIYDSWNGFEHILGKINRSSASKLVLINKIDVLKSVDDLEQEIEKWKKIVPEAEILPISAKEHIHTDFILPKIVSLLPIHPPYYDTDSFTDRPERFFVSEIIREKILELYEKEIPYSTEVVVESFKETENEISIEAIIYVERDSQKGIIIGHQGKALSKLGKAARLELQDFFSKKIQLHLFVKVLKNWRKNEKTLKKFGY